MKQKRILVTGGCGFIGTNFLKYMLKKYPNYTFINVDALTYAGNIENMKDNESDENYIFEKGDITDFEFIKNIFEKYNITDVIHFAAESHVDRSILNPDIFAKTNILGTLNLLNAAKNKWVNEYDKHRLHHVSTDEVYGTLELGSDDKFTEMTPYSPHSPYSASKAASDHFVKAYHDTYGLNITISNCSNNYGPYQFPEKLIPLVIHRLESNEKIPIYGNGENIRDWLYVEDHAKAIDVIFHNGKNGETYNVGGNQPKTNNEIVKSIIDVYNEIKKTNIMFEDIVIYVNDRLGHDKRYEIDSSKLQENLNWQPEGMLNTHLKTTIKWYLDNKNWLNNIISGEYREWINKNYK